MSNYKFIVGDKKWWRQAVVYQIYPRSFADLNGDGIGDLAGMIDRVPYLKSLSIDAVWLSPFYPSELADGGYDVADYRNVDPRIGTLQEFDKLIEELDAELAEHKWIGSDSMSLADIAFAPYATRLEHLHLSAIWHHKPHFKDWYERLQRTGGYQQGLAGWFNPKYLELMDRAGAEAWPNISAMLD